MVYLKDFKIGLDLDKNISDKIKFLCSKIPAHEWSGVLFYDVQGSIKDPSTFKIICKDLYLMDKGSVAATEYAYDESLIDFRMTYPETNKYRIGHIHSHNSMGTFFSGTDNSELCDNSEFHNYYLSVIVNNKFDISARIAFRGTRQPMNIMAKDENGDEYSIVAAQQETVLFYYDCEFTHSVNFSEDFLKRVDQIIKKAERKTTAALLSGNGQLRTETGFWLNNRWYPNGANPNATPKHDAPKRYINEGEVLFDVEDDNEVEEDDLLQQYSEMEDFMVDVLTSYPEINRELQEQQEELTLLDDVFIFLKGRIGKGKRNSYMDYVMKFLPVMYEERFVTETYSMDNYVEDLTVMIELLESSKDTYVNARVLYDKIQSKFDEINNSINGR